MPGTEPAPFTALRARLWRALPPGADPLTPAPSPEGRFHHSGQAALYLSPSGYSARRATARQGAQPLSLRSYDLNATRIADLRRPATLAALGLTGHEASRPWRPERIAARPATSWQASDAARRAGCEGLIWTSRNAPHLWHLVLFTWHPGTLTVLPGSAVMPPQR